MASTSDLAETKDTSAESSDLLATATGENSLPVVTAIMAWNKGEFVNEKSHVICVSDVKRQTRRRKFLVFLRSVSLAASPLPSLPPLEGVTEVMER